MGYAYSEQSNNHYSVKRSRKRERRFFVVFGYANFVKRHAPPWYSYVRKATKGEDRKGCDAFMGTDIGEIGIDVKSSEYGVLWYLDRQKSGERPGNIALVAVAESYLDHGENIRDRAFLAVGRIRERLLRT